MGEARHLICCCLLGHAVDGLLLQHNIFATTIYSVCLQAQPCVNGSESHRHRDRAPAAIRKEKEKASTQQQQHQMPMAIMHACNNVLHAHVPLEKKMLLDLSFCGKRGWEQGKKACMEYVI